MRATLRKFGMGDDPLDQAGAIPYAPVPPQLPAGSDTPSGGTITVQQLQQQYGSNPGAFEPPEAMFPDQGIPSYPTSESGQAAAYNAYDVGQDVVTPGGAGGARAGVPGSSPVALSTQSLAAAGVAATPSLFSSVPYSAWAMLAVIAALVWLLNKE